MLDLAQGQVFVTTVAPSGLIAGWVTVGLVLITIITASVAFLSENSESRHPIWGIIAVLALGSTGLMLFVGLPADFLHDGPSEEAQQTVVPSAELRERYGVSSQYLPDGLESKRSWEPIAPGVYLVREVGSFRGEKGVFWSIDSEDAASTWALQDEFADEVWVVDGPSVARGR